MKIRILRCAIEKLTVCHYEGKLIKGGGIHLFFPVIQEENLFPKVVCVDSFKKKII